MLFTSERRRLAFVSVLAKRFKQVLFDSDIASELVRNETSENSDSLWITRIISCLPISNTEVGSIAMAVAVAKTASDSQGNFKFANVDAELYRVAAEISSFGAASSAITGGARYVHSSLDSSPAVWLRSSVQLSGSDEEVRCSL